MRVFRCGAPTHARNYICFAVPVCFKITMRVAIVPGNGCTDVSRSLWYGWLRDKLVQQGVNARLENMPDPFVAREAVWLPFMKDELGCDETTIVVGHSSGAEAAMRFAEKNKVGGMILVSACVTDLGDDNERESGYYSRPWDWKSIVANVGSFIRLFGSTDDPFIPWEEMRQVSEGLGQHDDFRLLQFDDRGHFQSSKFAELLKCIMDSVR